jgi:N-acetylglutamate synthase
MAQMPATAHDEPSARGKARHENWIGAIASLARVVPGGFVHEVGGVTIVRSGLRIPAFNCVFALEPPCNLPAIEAEVERLLGREAVPWLLVATAESAGTVEPLLRSLRLRHVGAMPGMVWEPLPKRPPPLPEGLEVHLAQQPAELRTFGRTMMEGFGANVELMDPWADAVAAQGLPPSSGEGYYLGLSAGRPVCTAVRFSSGVVSGVYGVSTVPEFRRRGWGAAITCRAAVEGHRVGCRESYLQSSTMGRALYGRLGYRVVEEYQLWAPETATPPRGDSPDGASPVGSSPGTDRQRPPRKGASVERPGRRSVMAAAPPSSGFEGALRAFAPPTTNPPN